MSRYSPIQTSFNSGEWAPEMSGRTDLPQFPSSSAIIENFDIIPQGGIIRRSGTRYVASTKDSTKAATLIPFEVSDDQAYQIEAGDFYFRFYTDEGALIGKTLSGIADVDIDSDELTSESHGYADEDGALQITTTGALPGGLALLTDYYIVTPPTLTVTYGLVDPSADTVEVSSHGLSPAMGPFHLSTTKRIPGGLSAATDYWVGAISGSDFSFFANRTDAIAGTPVIDITDLGSGTLTITPTYEYARNKFRLSESAGGAAVDLTTFGTSAHTLTPVSDILTEIVTPYAEADVSELSFDQSADILYIAHKDYEPMSLLRYAASAFQLQTYRPSDGPYIDENTTGKTMEVSSATSVGDQITIECSESFFVDGDIGRLIRINDTNATPDPDVTHWGVARIVGIDNSVNDFTDANFDDYTPDMEMVTTGVVNGGAADQCLSRVGWGSWDSSVTEHPLCVRESAGQIPDNLNIGDGFFVRYYDANRMGLHETAADAAADTNRFAVSTLLYHPCTVLLCQLSLVAHGLADGEGPVRLSTTGTLPDGLEEDTDYWVGVVDVDHIYFTKTPGGRPAGPYELNGSGTHTIISDKSSTAQAVIESEFAEASPETTWRLGAWSTGRGFPRSVGFHDGRLWWSSTTTQPDTSWGSRSSKFNIMSPTGELTGDITDLDSAVSDSNAITVTSGARTINGISWLLSHHGLGYGTSAGTWIIRSGSESGITPTSIEIERNSGDGSASGVRPVLVGESTVFVSDTSRKLLALRLSENSLRHGTEDFTLMSRHITGIGLTDIDYAASPIPTVHCIRSDGQIPVLTLITEEEVQGWGRRVLGGVYVDSFGTTIPTASGNLSADTITLTAHGYSTGDMARVKEDNTLPGGLAEHTNYWLRAVDVDTVAFYTSKVAAETDSSRVAITSQSSGSNTMGLATAAVAESVSVIPAPSGDPSSTGRTNQAHDQVWCIVKRTVNNATVRHVEFFEDPFDTDDALEDAYMVDGGLSYDGAAAALSDLTAAHLANEHVHVLADGEDLTLQLDGSGDVPAAYTDEYSTIHLGLQYTANWQSQRMNLPDEQGTTQAKKGRIDHVTLRLLRTVGLKIGASEATLEDRSDYVADVLQLAGVIPPTKTGDVEIPLDAPWETYGELYIRQDRPLPMGILAVMTQSQRGSR